MNNFETKILNLQWLPHKPARRHAEGSFKL